MLDKSRIRLIYVELLKGYSKVQNDSFGLIYVKHFNSRDLGEIDLHNEFFLNEAIKSGLPTQKEREAFLLEDGVWNPEKDNLIFDYKQTINRLKITKSKLFKTAEIAKVAAELKIYEDKLSEIENERKSLIGFVAEDYAGKKTNEFYLFQSLFKDESLSAARFSLDDFNELEDEQIKELSSIYTNVSANFNQTNIKRIAVSPFFFNVFILSEGVLDFFGKSLSELTLYQIELYSHARFFRTMLQDSKTKPDESLLEDPDKLIEWFEGTKNAQETLEKNNNNVNSIVGLTDDDRKKLGASETAPNPFNKLVEMAGKKGSELNMTEIMKVMGQKSA